MNIILHEFENPFQVTKAEITYAELSMFEPKMQLSDNFRYVIENMPCCEVDDADIEEYIKDFIFDNFGFTYITRVLLGGIAQENIVFDRQTHERMVNMGVNTKHQAQISFRLNFGMSVGTSIENSEDKSTYNSFMREVKWTESTTLGGDTSLTTMAEWSRTVPSNPAIVHFTVRDIFRLLTAFYFPMDPLIKNKSDLIRLTLDRYLNATSDYCYGDCGGNNGSRGICVSSGHFHFGECHCKPEWTGPDCTVPVTTTNKILHGTICGFDRSFMKVNCEGLSPHTKGCPSGWIQKIWDADLTVCYKNGTSIVKPIVGTLCGLYVIYPSIIHGFPFHYYPGFSSDTPCSNMSLEDSTNINLCPSSYQKMTAKKGTEPYRNTVCASINAEADLSGTICGMQVEGTIDGPTCDGYNSGLHQCPPKYTLQRTVFNNLGFLFCVKN
jgi:hypothetical protein